MMAKREINGKYFTGERPLFAQNKLKVCDTTFGEEEPYSYYVDIQGSVDSVKNPSGGRIRVDEIGDLIMEDDRVDTDKTKIVCPHIIHKTGHI